MIGFSFADESEAGELYKKILNRAKYGKSRAASFTALYVVFCLA